MPHEAVYLFMFVFAQDPRFFGELLSLPLHVGPSGQVGPHLEVSLPA